MVLQSGAGFLTPQPKQYFLSGIWVPAVLTLTGGYGLAISVWILVLNKSI